MHKIPINDMSRHAASIQRDIETAIGRVVASGWYILGQEVAAFEQEFADFCGAEYCIGVANGTDALELGLRAIGVGPGIRVATVANAGFYTSTALLALGAIPIYIDVERSTHLMDLNQLAMLAETGGINAVVVTHLYGLMHDMDAVMKIAGAAGIAVLEDCAQAHGARRGATRAGAAGHASSFSFYPTKNLGALGDAGAVVTSDAQVAARVRLLRQYGWESKYRAVIRGARNSRLDEMQAAILRAKLVHLEGWNARRRALAWRYSQGINHPRLACPSISDDAAYVAHLYVVTTDDREDLRHHLAEVGIATDIHYPVPDHLQPLMMAERAGSSLPVTEMLARSVLTLPCYPELTDEEADRIIARVNNW